MHRRDVMKFGVGGAAAAFTGGLNLPAFAQAKVELKSSDVHPFGYPTVEAVKSLGEKLTKATNGKFTVQIYPSMQLGGEKEMIEQAQLGALAMARVSVGAMGPVVDELNAFNMPFVFKSAQQAHKVLDGSLGDEMLDKITNSGRGLVGLCWMDGGARNIYNSKRPIKTVEDLKGLKIRVIGNPIFVAMMNALGGNGVAMGFDQLINAMQTGIVDGAENNYPSYANGQHYRYAKFYSVTEHLILPELLVFSKRTWDTLSKEEQELIKKFAREAQAEQRKLWADLEVKALETMKKEGAEITQIPDKGPFQAAVKPVWDQFGTKYTEVVKRIQQVS
jgi:tripartite ATP-independent transporter DctP family solute receptor